MNPLVLEVTNHQERSCEDDSGDDASFPRVRDEHSPCKRHKVAKRKHPNPVSKHLSPFKPARAALCVFVNHTVLKGDLAVKVHSGL